MNVLFCASEAAPFAASGGLGDVAGSLPRAIRNRKVACRVVMPLYGDMKQEYREKLTYITNFTVPVGWRNQYCGLFELTHNGVKYYFWTMNTILNELDCTAFTMTASGLRFSPAPFWRCCFMWTSSPTSSTPTIGRRRWCPYI